MSKIELSNIYKVFGKRPASVLNRVKEGVSKEDILKNTGHTVGLKNINLKIDESEMFMVMGLSGSGKSTLIRHINRLIDPTGGEVRIDGENILEFGSSELLRLRRRKVSMVFQKFGLFPHKTVVENVAYGLKIQGVSRTERRKTARDWISRVGLKGYEESFPRGLSGGMQQRVGLARALAVNPEVLLLDEPFSALDPLIRSDMQKLLGKLQSELKKTVVFITHDLDEALTLGDRIAMLRDGEIVQVGTPKELVNNPVNDYVASFVESVVGK